MIVTSNGTLHNLADKIFIEDVLKDKKTMSKKLKLTKSIKRFTKKQIEEEIGKDSHIFSGNNDNSCKSMHKNSATMPLSNYNRQPTLPAYTITSQCPQNSSHPPSNPYF